MGCIFSFFSFGGTKPKVTPMNSHENDDEILALKLTNTFRDISFRKLPKTENTFEKAVFRRWTTFERWAIWFVLIFAHYTYYWGVVVVLAIQQIIDLLALLQTTYLYGPIGFLAQDGERAGKGVKYPIWERYGPRPREKLVVMAPEKEGPFKAVMYLHGGGFVAANAECLLHSMTPLVRRGFTVFCPNYERADGLSEENAYPSGVISVLTALAYLKRERGIESIGILGDSAGGSLCLMTGCFITNPDLLVQLLDMFDTYPKELANPSLYPTINSQCSICGLLDRSSFVKRRLTNIYFAENLFMIIMCKFCLFMYETQADGIGPNIDDICDKINTLPPTNLIAGLQDPLLFSSWRVYEKLSQRFDPEDVHFHAYWGRHVFFGFPTGWTCGQWRISARPCVRELCDFFDDYAEN